MVRRLRQIRNDSDFRQDQEGALLVEFAICILVILTVVFMTIELSSAAYTYTVLSDAANEGLRYAIVHSSDSSGAVAKVKTYAALSMHDVSKINVTVSCIDTGGCVPPNRVTVSVSYPYIPYTGFMTNPPTMSAFAEGRLVY